MAHKCRPGSWTIALAALASAWSAPTSAAPSEPGKYPPQTEAAVAPVTEYPLPEDVLREAASLFGAMRRNDAASASTALGRLAELRATAQVPDLTPVAAAFLAEFPRATEGDTPVVRRALAADAIPLAPDYPPMHFLLARSEMATGVAGVGRAATAAIAGVEAMARYPRGVVADVANAAFYLVLALLVIAVAVGLMLLLRHLAQLSHDIGDAFPAAPAVAFSLSDVAQSRKARFIIGSGLGRVLGRVVVGLVLLLPIALGAGLLAGTVFWVVVASVYARRAEVAGSILVLLAIAAIPILGAASRAPAAVAPAAGPSFWTCIREHCGERDAVRATRRIQEMPDDTWARLALAAREVHTASLRPSALASAAHHLESARPDGRGIVETWLGNVHVLRSLAACEAGDKADGAALASAAKAYEGATTRGNPAAWYGLALAQGLANNRDGMEGTLKDLVARTTEDDLSFVVRIRTLTASSSEVCANVGAIARELRNPGVPDWTVYLDGVVAASFVPVIPFPWLLTGRLPAAGVSFVAVAGLIAVIALVSVRRRFRLAAACPRCGTVSCTRCNRHASGFDYCPTCLLEQVRPAFLDPLDLVAVQNRQSARARRGRLLVPLLGILVPGSGQVLAGRPVRGIVMLVVLATAVSRAGIPVPPAIDAGAYGGQAGQGLPLFPPIALCLVYCWSAMDVWLSRAR
ncbi:MAG: hypothetical protein FJ087_14695 [Deltaproteobacteria bacterium]|nr:hypothetical protein [Deltaproteobacteria bacterium]